MSVRARDFAQKATLVVVLALIGGSLPTENPLWFAIGGAILAIAALAISIPIRTNAAAREQTQSRSSRIGLRISFGGFLSMVIGWLVALRISEQPGIAIGILGFLAVLIGITITRFGLLETNENDA